MFQKPSNLSPLMLKNLSGLRTGRMQMPASPVAMKDVWEEVEDILLNLPNTTKLTVDDLVGHSQLRRYRPADKAECCGCEDSSCGEVR